MKNSTKKWAINMENKMQIESDIPIPMRKQSPYSFLDEMKQGQNVLVGTEQEAYRVRDAMRYRKMNYVTRKTREGWRVWYLGRKK